MPKVIIINGASGVGKTFLLNNIEARIAGIRPVRKYTSRSPNKFEDSGTKDLYFSCAIDDIKLCDYYYKFPRCEKHRGSVEFDHYGIARNELSDVIAKGHNPIVIVRDNDTIKHIKDDFPGSIALYLQGLYTSRDLAKQLKKQGRRRKNIKYCIETGKAFYDDFVETLGNGLYDGVLLNYYDDSIFKQLEQIVSKK